MKVALAGGGRLAHYLVEELPTFGIEPVILTRSKKPWFESHGIEQRLTDYSVQSLTKSLSDCDAVVSVILDYTMAFTEARLNLIKAAQESPKCRRFIPSEYGGDLEEQPDQPLFYNANHEPVRKVLMEQNTLEWTIVSAGWFLDYLFPEDYRHYKGDIGEAFPLNIATKTVVIPGTGRELLDFVSARDASKGIGALLKAPQGSWEPYTYLSGCSLC
ncbi:uncharacterized protein A1O5_13264 [Cladophialophora psammophila CBS 110553]|uniref:NAD(P)-binding domain-containing protein n=1 Tax=Cladophialophora psammophila CBS 110553 TaxID=1182543 RepID=W9VDF2_9EURO|nr:uncharacterized protein A1O5_13264 [Cladophialophora psammophila CBS 110553]EXJ53488.1 hypothetical protein A1O5_13264 [Cladophialophora psammophila CBS 110553]